ETTQFSCDFNTGNAQSPPHILLYTPLHTNTHSHTITHRHTHTQLHSHPHSHTHTPTHTHNVFLRLKVSLLPSLSLSLSLSLFTLFPSPTPLYELTHIKEQVGVVACSHCHCKTHASHHTLSHNYHF